MKGLVGVGNTAIAVVDEEQSACAAHRCAYGRLRNRLQRIRGVGRVGRVKRSVLSYGFRVRHRPRVEDHRFAKECVMCMSVMCMCV